ncbi:MAG: UpxY family transcription antiterminator [Muribaculaceae bacterium]|nr:UpxY family transcription antiterminator [Muribaculaceae bacterium]
MEVRTVIKKGREVPVWYPLRVTYNRELKVKEDLDARGVTNFVPMQYRREERGGVMVKRLVPSIHNLIFVKMKPSEMIEYRKTTDLPVRYIMNREKHIPITVPDREMENFIKVAGTYNEKLIYLNPDPGDFSEGERVRIIGGEFEGAEGIFVRIKRDRRVLINIQGVVAVATTHVHLSMLEKITDPDDNSLDNAL